MFSQSCDNEHAVAKATLGLILVVVGWMDGTSCEAIWPILHPYDVVRQRTSAKSWNEGSKYGSYGELSFFLLQIDQHKYPEGSMNTPLDKYEFTPIKKKNSIINRLRKWRLTPRGDSNASALSERCWSNVWMITTVKCRIGASGHYLVTMTTTILL